MLDKQKNLKLISNNIYLTTAPVAGLPKISVTFDVNSKNIYPNKKIKILTDNNIVLTGILKTTNNINYWIMLDTPLVNNAYNLKGIYYETFETLIDSDNTLVTFSDIKKSLLPSEDLYDEFDDLLELGNSGIVSSLDFHKIKDTKFEHSYINHNIISIIGSNPIPIGIINIMKTKNKNKKFKHVFGITGKAYNLLVEISVNSNFNNNVDLDNKNFELKVLNNSTIPEYKNIEIQFNIVRKTSLTSDYLIITSKFDITKIPTNIQTDPFLNNKIYHFVSDVSDVSFVENVQPNTTSNVLSFSKGIFGTISYDSTFIINENVLGYTQNGVTLLKDKFSNITDYSNINDFLTPGRYIKNSGNINSITNRPVLTFERFLLTITNYGSNLTPENIVQRYDCYEKIGLTTNYQLLSFERVSTKVNNDLIWSPWIEVSKKGHKHLAADITESTTKRFVSQTDVNNWNALIAGGSGGGNSNWKATVTTSNQLYSTYPTPQIGWNAFVIQTNSIWSFNGNVWENQKTYVSETTDGFLTAQNYKDYILSASLDKKVNTKESYIHRLTESPEIIYGANYSMINENHIDKVKRTTPILNQLREYVIQEGWNVLSSGTNSYLKGRDIESSNNYNIGTGIGLKFNKDNQIIFGKYNKISNNEIFLVGNGNSDIDRKNIFSIFDSGITLANGYSIPLGTANDILLANGQIINKFTFIQEIYNGIASAATETITVPSGTENFVINWTEVRKVSFGRIGKIEVWIKQASNIYNKQEVPIKMITQLDIDNKLEAVSYTITLSNLEALILIS